jgi:glycosyltransferase involved in cell wall biosynthesis
MLSRSVAIIGTRGFPSYYGGFETAVRELAPYLVARGWDVTVYGRKKALKANDPLIATGVKSQLTPGLEFKSLSTLSYGLTATVHAIARARPDVALVMNCANGFYLPLLKRAGIPTIVNVDGIEWEREKWGKRARQIFYKGAELTARYADTLVFDAHAIGDYWKREFGRDGVHIPYGGRFRDELPLEPGLTHRGYILAVARFVPENTIPEFLRAAETLSKTWPVVIVGSSGYGGPLDQQVDNLVQANPKVRWLGHVADDDRLHSLWQHAGCYFHGHSVGGTNPALVQAMALGAPTVARETVYNREVLGQAGRYTAPDQNAIAAEIRYVMRSRSTQTSLSSEAQDRAAQDFTWPKVNKTYEHTIEQCTSAP